MKTFATKLVAVGALIAPVLVGPVVGDTGQAAAVPPPALEYPDNWQGLSSTAALGTTDSGILVLAEILDVSDDATIALYTGGPSVINGPTPDFLPQGAAVALWPVIEGCAASPCGTVQFTFGVPIDSATLYLSDQGGIEVVDTVVTRFRSTPVTVLDGAAFSYRTPTSRNALSELSADGTTLYRPDIASAIGLPADNHSCGSLYACFAADVVLAGPTTTIRFELGSDGVGTAEGSPPPTDALALALGFLPSAPEFSGTHSLAQVNGAEPGPQSTVHPGDSVTFEATATNTGTLDGTTVLTEKVPEGSVYRGVDEGWECATGSPAGTTCTQSVTLAPGDTVSRRFSIAVYDEVPGTMSELVATLAVSPGTCPDCTVSLPVAGAGSRTAPPAQLAATGSDLSTPTLGALAMIVAGCGLALVPSRRLARAGKVSARAPEQQGRYQ